MQWINYLLNYIINQLSDQLDNPSETAAGDVLQKKVFLKISQRKNPVLQSLFNKVAGLKGCNLLTSLQVFFCEIRDIFRNN